MERLSRAYARFLDALGATTGLLIALGTLLIATDVAMRNLWQTGLPWLDDIVEYGLYATTFLAAPWVLRHGAHVRVDIIVTSVPTPVARVMEILADLGGLTVSALMLVYSLVATEASFAHGSLIMKSLIFPEWWVLAVMPVSCVLLVIEFLLRIRRALLEPAEIRSVPPEL
jgi:TRAP-type C4-dicarboxylate transport system permease small subunit